MFKNKKPCTKNPVLIVLDTFLRVHHPLVFTKFRPLKIGIHKDLLETHKGVDEKILLKYLGTHTNLSCYLEACINHDFRYDLNGSPVSTLSADDKEYYKNKLLKKPL